MRLCSPLTHVFLFVCAKSLAMHRFDPVQNKCNTSVLWVVNAELLGHVECMWIMHTSVHVVVVHVEVFCGPN